MELARVLLRLWERRIWLAIGAIVAVAVGLAGTVAFKSTVYASASTQMLVDAPQSALGNAHDSLLPYTDRAAVFARLMVSPEALSYIGRQAGIPGNEIAAEGPAEIGAPQAEHKPSVIRNGKLVAPSSKFVLRFDQNPDLPTVDIYSQAPTSHQAIVLANAAVNGFAKYLSTVDAQSHIPGARRVTIRQLGGAQGGIVDSGTGTALAALLGLIVFILWCFGILFTARLAASLGASREETPDEPPLEYGALESEASRLLLPDGALASTRRDGFGGEEETMPSRGRRANYAVSERL